MPTAVKALEKYQNAPRGSHKKSQILIIRFLNKFRNKGVLINKVFDSRWSY